MLDWLARRWSPRRLSWAPALLVVAAMACQPAPSGPQPPANETALPSPTASTASPTPTTATAPAIAQPSPTTTAVVPRLEPTATRAAQPTQPTATAPPPPAPPTVPPPTGNIARGRVLYVEKGCILCHGEQAEGNIGPRLAGTTLTFEQVRQQIRNPRDVMPRFAEADVADQDIRDLYSFERSLGQP